MCPGEVHDVRIEEHHICLYHSPQTAQERPEDFTGIYTFTLGFL